MLLDVNDGSLLGYRVGSLAPVSLGGEHLQLFDDGYAINVIDGKISSIFTCYRDGYEGFRSFKGGVSLDGRVLHFDNDTDFEKVIQVFGDPVEQWNDGVEMCAEFKVNDVRVEVIWNVDGRQSLDYISLERVNAI
ncbi:hypothetical protein ACL7TT_18450 [Microbulbifer sp. 2304DJ12-6]|uniref:hypothetical protein n=1 Tax=Microbulbifer sp. 2304DJ12-6 TaxID=3233340 RepID=UPI0039B11D73